ncbi:LOW QUALITY PROTEIN: programmed cell death 1 ligand 1-like [Guaruba guarouba]
MGSNGTHMVPDFRKTVIATQQFFQVTRVYPVQLCFTGVILDFLFIKLRNQYRIYMITTDVVNMLLYLQLKFLNLVLRIVKHGSNVTMECRFPVNGSLNLGLLSVIWEQKMQVQSKSIEVYTLCNGKAFLPSQHHEYIERAALLHCELIYDITSMKITDTGSCLCLIDYQGVDYRYITLKVKEAFPLADVFWQNENFSLSVSANTTYKLTADSLCDVTSILTFTPNMSGNYSCMFWNKELN